MPRLFFAVIALAFASLPAAAQPPPPRFGYPLPPGDTLTITRDVKYGTSGATELRLDVFAPKAGARVPALIFSNFATGADRSNPFYASWAQVAASRGLVAILPDLRRESYDQDFDLLLSYLSKQGGDHGIDPAAIAVYAGSGNVSRAFPYLEKLSQTIVKSAVMYYGSAPVTEYRRDLPVLFVRAGLDRPEVNRDIASMAAAAIAQNAPLTLLNNATGHHGFEMLDHDEATREVMDRTIDFVKRTTGASYQAALREGMAEATAAGHVLNGRFREAAAVFAGLLERRPEDARLRLSYGEALLGDGQFARACTELSMLKGKGLGPRDLGVPAAKSCAQAGQADAAVAWLVSIPHRFLPPALEKDPVFVSLQGRADFKAAFQPR